MTLCLCSDMSMVALCYDSSMFYISVVFYCVQMQVAELKVQLKMTEETRDSIRRDLIEANRKIREGGSSN